MGRHAELVPEVVDVGVILVERVTVDLNRHLRDEAMAEQIGITEISLIDTGRSNGALGERRSAQDDVEDHVVEEISKLQLVRG